jgi:hypothetical protein
VKKVKVVNGPNMPVSVNVENMPVVKADQMGTWNVGITNDTSNPVPVVVQGGSGNGQEKELVEIAERVGNSEGFKSVYTVPTGKQLIIKDVTISAISLNCSPAIARPGDSQPKVIVQVSLPILSVHSGHPIGATFTKTYEAGIKFDQEETLSLKANCVNDAFFELRGYLVDA